MLTVGFVSELKCMYSSLMSVMSPLTSSVFLHHQKTSWICHLKLSLDVSDVCMCACVCVKIILIIDPYEAS